MLWDREMLTLYLHTWFWIRRVQLASADARIYLVAYIAVQLCYVLSNHTQKCKADMWKRIVQRCSRNHPHIFRYFSYAQFLINFCRIGQVSQHSAPLDTLKAMKLVKGTAATVHWCSHPQSQSGRQRWTYNAGGLVTKEMDPSNIWHTHLTLVWLSCCQLLCFSA